MGGGGKIKGRGGSLNENMKSWVVEHPEKYQRSGQVDRMLHPQTYIRMGTVGRPWINYCDF